MPLAAFQVFPCKDMGGGKSSGWDITPTREMQHRSPQSQTWKTGAKTILSVDGNLKCDEKSKKLELKLRRKFFP